MSLDHIAHVFSESCLFDTAWLFWVYNMTLHDSLLLDATWLFEVYNVTHLSFESITRWLFWATATWHHIMGWLRLVGSSKLLVSFAKEPYKRDYILQKRPIISRSLPIVAKKVLMLNCSPNELFLKFYFGLLRCAARLCGCCDNDHVWSIVLFLVTRTPMFPFFRWVCRTRLCFWWHAIVGVLWPSFWVFDDKDSFVFAYAGCVYSTGGVRWDCGVVMSGFVRVVAFAASRWPWLTPRLGSRPQRSQRDWPLRIVGPVGLFDNKVHG